MAYRSIAITSNQPPKEGIAYGTIYPGMLLERTATANQVQPHTDDRGRVYGNLVAVEDSLQGNDVNDAYTAANQCFFKSFLPGDEILGYVGIGTSIAIGDQLCSNGAGALEKFTQDSSFGGEEPYVFGTALEACTAIAATVIRVEVA